MPGYFIAATGTEVGKTWLTRGLARSLVRGHSSVAALKPIETGVVTRPLDADAIARASGQPADADLPEFYRAAPPLAPYAITLQGDHDPLIMDPLISMISSRRTKSDWILVEAAGGILVPLNERETNADLAARLDLPLLLVAKDELGTLSHTLTAMESAQRHALKVAAVVLTQSSPNAAAGSNHDILSRLLAPTPVFAFHEAEDDDEALADEAERCGLMAMLLAQSD